MAAIVGRTREFGVKQTGTSVTVPNNDVAKLMYYLDCICVVLDLNEESGLSKLRDFRKYYLLSKDEEMALLILCAALNPIELDGKCISAVDSISGGHSNTFIELSSTEINFLASDNVLIGGRERRVTSIMLYTMQWIEKNYLEPLKQLAEKVKRTETTWNRRTETTSYRRPEPVTYYSRSSVSTVSSNGGGCCCTIL